jgi:hypothetical protein
MDPKEDLLPAIRYNSFPWVSYGGCAARSGLRPAGVRWRTAAGRWVL